jgi:hypothetical protein
MCIIRAGGAGVNLRRQLTHSQFAPSLLRLPEIVLQLLISELSDGVPKASDKRTAISELMPARPLTTEERVFRLTPSAAAVSVMERPSGSRQSSCNTSRERGGFCISMRDPQ